MPDPLILYPLAMLTLPGLLAYGLGRIAGSIWPGLAIAALATGYGLWLLSRAAGAGAAEDVAVGAIIGVFLLAAPAVLSALVGAVVARLRGSRGRVE